VQVVKYQSSVMHFTS